MPQINELSWLWVSSLFFVVFFLFFLMFFYMNLSLSLKNHKFISFSKFFLII